MTKKLLKILLLIVSLSLFAVSCSNNNPTNPGGNGGNTGGNGGNTGGNGGNTGGNGGNTGGGDETKYGIDSAYYGQWYIYYNDARDNLASVKGAFTDTEVPLFDNVFANNSQIIDVSKYDEYGSGYTFYKLENSSVTVLLYFKDKNTGYAIQYNSAGEAVRYAALFKNEPVKDRLDSTTFNGDWYRYTDKYCNISVSTAGHLTIVAPDSSIFSQGDVTYKINAYGITKKTGSSFLDPSVYYDITSFPYKGSIENAAEESEEEFKSINLILSSHDDLFEMKKFGSDITIKKATFSKYIDESGLKKTQY